MSQLITTGLLSALSLVAAGFAAPLDNLSIVGRDVSLLPSYDYIVVGGGTSGLTVANRLTEDEDKTVLVIEAGNLDDQEDAVLIPGLAGGTGKKYMYNITCNPQAGINNRTYNFLAAHVVGGGTVVNGQAFDRGSRGDYDLWEALGNPGWGWEGLLPYFKKSETFTPSPPNVAKTWGTQFDPKAHGFRGPVKSSMPIYYYPAMRYIFKAWEEFGIKHPKDGTNGEAIGAFFFSNSVDSVTRTRSYARTAHYEPVKDRSNLHLLTGKTVTKLVIKGKKVTGVMFSTNATAEVTTVSANKEVILAAGSGHTPQILQLSGIGPKKLLKGLGIPVVSDLPGVGENFQDHPTYYVAGTFANDLNPSPRNLTTNATYAGEMLELYKSTLTGPYSSGFGAAAAFLKLSDITNKTQIRDFVNIINHQDPTKHLPAGIDQTIIDGYKVQSKLLMSYLESGLVAIHESPFSASAGMGAALQKPFSRGSIYINTTDPFSNPVVDYRIFSNPIDLDIFVGMIKTVRKVSTMPALVKLAPIITNPDPDLQTDEEIMEAIKTNVVPTLAHPSCTCPMMKREHGGVVDSKLRVYGVSNLSIVDGSIMPLIPSTHLSSTVYAVAEKAADIIKTRA